MVNVPVDVRVPIFSLDAVKAHLEDNQILYSVMIKDLQVQTHMPTHGNMTDVEPSEN